MNRRRVINRLSSMYGILIILSVLAFGIFVSVPSYANANVYTYANANANQCFIDSKAAYAFLIAQEQAELQIAKQGMRFLVNINTASESELTALTGIGSKKAQDIIRYREGFGRFNSVDELTNVKGIGHKTVEKNRSRLTAD